MWWHHLAFEVQSYECLDESIIKMGDLMSTYFYVKWQNRDTRYETGQSRQYLK